MKRAEYRRFRRPIGFAVVDQVDHHRNPQRVRKENEFLPLVAAHPAGFGQDLDGLKPLRLGQFDFLDEGVKVVDKAEHDPPQPRIRRLREAL